jgi:multidrug efflux system outer membrane protein
MIEISKEYEKYERIPANAMMINLNISALVVTCALGLTGCVTVGVDYRSPEVGAPDAWAADIAEDIKGRNTSLEKWWKHFNDPVLNKLIERTRQKNPNLRIASQSIAQARASRGIATSQLFPQANAGGEYSRNRSSESLGGPAPKNPSNFYDAGFDAGWEIDIFGGIRRNIESADASIGASVESYRDLLVTLFAETAVNYVEYRTLEDRIEIAKKNIASQDESVKLTQARFDAGQAPKIDVTRAISNVEISRALIPQLKQSLAFSKNQIATLTGGYPASVEKLLARSRPIPVPRKGFSAGLPADLIRARPDVRKAERQLAAQTAQIGVAEADLYPRFSLFGNFSLQSVNGGEFWNSSSRAYSFGPSFSWQIFSAGRIRSNIDIQESLTEQALDNYENSVLVAVAEVENSMAAIANERDRIATLGKAVAAAVETVSLIKSNYEDGLIDFQQVLDAERTKFSTEDEATSSRGQIASNYIQLYTALGGGSEVEVIPIKEPTVQARRGLFAKKRDPNAEPAVELIQPDARNRAKSAP